GLMTHTPAVRAPVTGRRTLRTATHQNCVDSVNWSTGICAVVHASGSPGSAAGAAPSLVASRGEFNDSSTLCRVAPSLSCHSDTFADRNPDRDTMSPSATPRPSLHTVQRVE